MESRLGDIETLVGRVNELEDSLRAQEDAAARALNEGILRGRAEAQEVASRELERLKANLLDVQGFIEEARL